MTKVNIPTLKLNNGREIPVLGYGTWLGSADKFRTSDIPKLVEALSYAIDIGYRHVDTAHVYRVEPEVGQVINNKIREGVVKRDELFITTKVWQHFHRQGDVEVSLRGSLRRLELDYVDLLLMHWPFSVSEEGEDEKIDYLTTWRGFEEVLAKGLTKSIGVSNFNQEQLTRLLAHCAVRPAVNQIEVNVTLGQTDLITYCHGNQIQVVAYSPFGSMVADRAAPGAPPPSLADPVLQTLAQKYNKTVGQVTLRYLYQRGLVLIPKSITKSRVSENASLFDFHLDAEDVATIAKYDVGYRTVRPVFYQDMENYPFDKVPGTAEIPRSLRKWKNGANGDIN